MKKLLLSALCDMLLGATAAAQTFVGTLNTNGYERNDVTVNGVPAELKKVDSSKQIYRHARKAFEEQGAEAVVIEIKRWMRKRGSN